MFFIKKQAIGLTLLPVVLGLVTRLICFKIDFGVTELLSPAGVPAKGMCLIIWTVVFAGLGVAVALTLHAGDAGRYPAVRLLSIAFALYNLWPLLFFGKLWLNLSTLLGIAVVSLFLVSTRNFWRIDRRAGCLVALFTGWAVFELYITWSFSVLN